MTADPFSIDAMFDETSVPPGTELVQDDQANPDSQAEEQAAAEQEEDEQEVAASSDTSDEAESHQELAEEVDQQSDESDKQDVVQQFIDSQYGGDKEAFVKSLYESRKEMGLLAGQVKELTNIVASLTTVPDDFEEAESDSEPDPDVQLQEKTIQRLEKRQATYDTKIQSTLASITKAANRVAEIKGALAFADDDAASQLRREQQSLEARLEDLSGVYHSHLAEKEDLLADIDLAQTQLSKAQKAAESARNQARQQRQQARRTEAQQVQAWGEEARSNIASVVEKASFIPLTARDEIKEQIRYRVANAIRERGEPVDNLGKFAQTIATQHIKSLSEIARVKFAETSKVKAAATGKHKANGSTPSKGNKSTSPNPNWTAVQWEKYGKQLEREARQSLAKSGIKWSVPS